MGVIKIPNNAAVMQGGLNAAGTIWSQTIKPCGIATPASVVSSSSNCLNNQLPEPGYGYSQNYYGFGIAGNYAYAPNIHRTIIGKGAIPTQAEIDAFSGTSITVDTSLPRYTDALIILNPVNTANSAVLNSIKIPLYPVLARLSGTAAWFMVLNSGYLTLNGSNKITRTVAIVGSVSDMAGSGEIKLLTTNIIANSLYKLPAISIPFPTKFSW